MERRCLAGSGGSPSRFPDGAHREQRLFQALTTHKDDEDSLAHEPANVTSVPGECRVALWPRRLVLCRKSYYLEMWAEGRSADGQGPWQKQPFIPEHIQA